MQLPDRRKLFQKRHHRREEIEAQMRRAQIEEQYSTEDSSSEDEESSEDESEDEVIRRESLGGELEEVINENESEEFYESEKEDELEEGEDEFEEGEDEFEEDEFEEEEEDEDELEEEQEVDEEEYNLSLSKNNLTNGCGSHNKSNNMSLNTIQMNVNDSEMCDVYDKSINETLCDNTPIAIDNNVLMNKNNSDDVDKSQSLHDSNLNMNDQQNHIIEWMINRESQKPYGGIIATDMGTTDCKIKILLKLLSKSNVPNSDNTQSEGESDLDETIFSRGCTLILCPRSSIDDWIDCIDRNMKPGTYNVWVHYGKNRDISVHDLTQKDIVITTITLVLTGFRNKESNPLYQIKWHRIILDDIKLYNYKQQTSKALCQLSGICHWVFSTPTIINNDDDEIMYSLIKFINYKPLNMFENWKKWMKTNQTVSIYEKLRHLYYNKKIF